MRNREVTEADVARVIEQAKAVNIPLDRQIIHTVPLEYIIDGQGQIRDPIGMSGVINARNARANAPPSSRRLDRA